jgi:FkbH-like protein
MERPKHEIDELKLSAINALHERSFDLTEQILRQLWQLAPSVSLASWIVRQVKPHREQYCKQIHRVAFLRSFTIEPSVQIFEALAYIERIGVDTYIGEFDGYTQELLVKESGFNAFGAELTFIAVLCRSIAPELWSLQFAVNENNLTTISDRVVSHYEVLMNAFRKQNLGNLVVHALEEPRYLASGIADISRDQSQLKAVRDINNRLAELCKSKPGLFLLDFDRLVREYGATRFYDDSRWESIRVPMVSGAQDLLAKQWLRFLCATSRTIRKVIVCDLDDTLWRGVLGEVGAEGIEMNDSVRGTPHRELQRALIALHRRGILLAICSKNNHDEAWAVISGHPDMLLRPDHFAAIRINWQDKASNLLEIANELNVGVDSLVFLDDNPVEQHLIRSRLPQVRTLAVNRNPETYCQAVLDEVGFERLTLSEEDRRRSEIYAAQRKRDHLKQDLGDLEQYLFSLETVVEEVPLTGNVLDRVSQLSQKTNQFNLTSQRYSRQQIEALSQDPAAHVLAFSVKDKFGDSGIVGVAILSVNDLFCEIDSFLISCRVIGRGVETAMLNRVSRFAASRQCRELIGIYVPTERNQPCADFYENHSFKGVSGGNRWSYGLSEGEIPCPRWISMQGE